MLDILYPEETQSYTVFPSPSNQMAITKKTGAGKDTEGQDKPSHTTHGNAAGTTEITRNFLKTSKQKCRTCYSISEYIYNPGTHAKQSQVSGKPAQ